MFAKVVFKDNEEAVVPVDYIKDFDAQKVVPGDECPVFWSLKGKLTPKDVLKKQGVIHRIDQLKKQTDKHGNPLPGYYDAEIKMLADNGHFLDSLQLMRKDLQEGRVDTTRLRSALKMYRICNTRCNAET